MTNLENQPKNLENEFLKGLRNQAVIADIKSQVVSPDFGGILPHIRVLEIPGDVLKMVGLKSNRPKKFTWDYEQKKFGPGDVVVHKEEITDDDKLIFYTVFSEPIEKIAVGEKAAETVAKQSAQLAHDVRIFYNEEFNQNYACDLNRYHKNAVIRLNSDQMKEVQLIGELLITIGYQMTTPSTLFNKREERCNVATTKQLLLPIDYSLYARMKVASIYKSPSPVLDELEKIFTVVPCSMTGNVKAALIDSEGIALWQSLHERYLTQDAYVAAHKLLDHFWRKWVFVDYRPAAAIVLDETAKTNPILPKTTPKKDILTDYATLKDKATNFMSKAQGKAWNDFGFDYEAAEKWLEAGLLTDDAKFAHWLVNTKGGDNADPEWVRDEVFKGDVNNLEPLRKEFKKV